MKGVTKSGTAIRIRALFQYNKDRLANEVSTVVIHLATY